MQCKLEKEITARLLATKVLSNFQTQNVYEIADKLKIVVTFAKWFPVTLGEFDRKHRRIVVNQNAQISVEKIIAHELGHYFLEELKLQNKVEIMNEEKFCDEFAEILLKK